MRSLGAVIFSLIGVVVGALIGFGGNWWLEDRARIQTRDDLAVAFIADISAMKKIENQRFDILKAPLRKMVEVDSLKMAGGRPWLMPQVSTRFGLFEGNSSNLGFFEPPISVKVVEFYGLSYALRTHINLVTSADILWANTNERDLAVKQYRTTFNDWNQKADEILNILRNCCK